MADNAPGRIEPQAEILAPRPPSAWERLYPMSEPFPKRPLVRWVGSVSLLAWVSFWISQYVSLGGIVNTLGANFAFVCATAGFAVFVWGIAANLPRWKRTAQWILPLLALLAALLIHHAMPPKKPDEGNAPNGKDHSKPAQEAAAKSKADPPAFNPPTSVARPSPTVHKPPQIQKAPTPTLVPNLPPAQLPSPVVRPPQPTTSDPDPNNCPAPGTLVISWMLISERPPGAAIQSWLIQPTIRDIPAMLNRWVKQQVRFPVEPNQSESASALLSEIKTMQSLDDPKPLTNTYGVISNQTVLENIWYSGGASPTIDRNYHYSVRGEETGRNHRDPEIPLTELSIKSQNAIKNIDVWLNAVIDKRCIDGMAKLATPQ